MPGIMVHLSVAKRINPDADVRFLIGSVAPDAVSEWHAKDMAHLRSHENREAALADRAAHTDRDDSFAEGVLIHLFVDWKWDTTLRDAFIERMGEGWFSHYRDELGLSSAYLFYNTPWSKEVWQRMTACGISAYGEVEAATSEEVRTFLRRNYRWHVEHDDTASDAFPPGVVEEFIRNTSEAYKVWRGEHK